MPRFISQLKKPSPASPDQSVPSQSNAARHGLRRRTESTKAVAEEDTDGGLEVGIYISLSEILPFTVERGFPVCLVTDVVIIGKIGDDEPAQLELHQRSLAFINHFTVRADQQSVGNRSIPLGVKRA